MRNGAHNGRSVRLCRILAALLSPIRQFLNHVWIKLTSETGNLPATRGVRSMTRSACCDVLIGHPVLEDFFTCPHKLPWRATERWRIERVEICGKSRDHRRTQRM